MNPTYCSAQSRGRTIVLLGLLWLSGCGKDRDTAFYAPNEVVVAVKEDFNIPDRHVLSTQDTILTTLEFTALSDDVVIHEMVFDTSLGLQRMRVASSDGGRAEDESINFYRNSFRLFDQDGDPIMRIPLQQQRRDLIVYADTSDYKNAQIRVILRHLVISSRNAPGLHVLPINYIDLTIHLDPAPLIAVQAIDENRDYRNQGRGNADVLAEIVVSEISNDAPADLVQVHARLLTPGVTAITLVNANGSSVADTETSGFFNTDVTFQFITPLRFQPGTSHRLRIIGNLSNSPTIDVVALEIISLEFLSERRQTFSARGPEDANGQPVTFIAVYN